MATVEPFINKNVQDYSLQALNEAKLNHQPCQGRYTYLQIDFKQMGLGGDNSWSPRVHPEYLLTDKKYSYSFRLKAISKDEDANEILIKKLPEL